jgi:hypothetical protein
VTDEFRVNQVQPAWLVELQKLLATPDAIVQPATERIAFVCRPSRTPAGTLTIDLLIGVGGELREWNFAAFPLPAVLALIGQAVGNMGIVAAVESRIKPPLDDDLAKRRRKGDPL